MCNGRPEPNSFSMRLCYSSEHDSSFCWIKLETLTADKENPLTSIQDCVGKLQCNPPSETCCLGQCTECGNDDELKTILEDIYDEILVDQLTY